MNWLRTRGRVVLAFLADLGGALVFVALAAGAISAAIAGAVLAAWTAFPQPYFTLLVAGVALLAVGLVLHFLRDLLSSTQTPQPVAPAPPVVDPNAYSRAAALQRQHDDKAREEEVQKEAANLRRATRLIREELLDNRHAMSRVSGNPEELLAVRFSSWMSEKTTLLEQDDPKSYEMASAAYRELSGLLRGRVGESEVDGSPFIYGDPLGQDELIWVEQVIDQAVKVLV